MTRLSKCFCLFVFLLVLAPLKTQANGPVPSSIEAGDPLVVDARNGLNIRKSPNATRIGAIPNKSVIYATGEPQLHRSSYWLPVRFQAENNEWIHGWVYLKYTDVIPQNSVPTAPAAGNTPRTAYVTPSNDSDGVNKALTQQTAIAPTNLNGPIKLSIRVSTRARFRAGPGTNHEILGRFTNDTSVVVLGKPVGQWIPVQKEGSDEKGWVHVSLLEAEGELNPLELASVHKASRAETDRLISTYADEQETEANPGSTCVDGSCRNGGLSQIPVPAGGDFVRPVSSQIRSGFGIRRDPITGQQGSTHRGTDFAGKTGDPVRPIQAGVVEQIKTNCRVGDRGCGGGWGNHIIINHGNGLRSVYAHLSQVNVRVGERVGINNLIGGIGSTGRSTGPHLHLEIHENGVPVNPMNHLH